MKQVSLVMEGLTAIEQNGEKLLVAPRLANSWQFLSPKRIVFKLRRNVRWSDGTPLDSSHFLAAWKRLLKNANKTPKSRLLFVVEGAKEFSQGSLRFSKVGIKTPDPWTILVRLKQPVPGFPARFAHPATWPIRYENRSREAFPVVLGPFLPKEPKPLSSNLFVANSDYYRGKPKINEITVSATQNAQERILLFLNGETDLVDDLNKEDTEQLKRNRHLQSQASLSLVTLYLNPRTPPLKRKVVRKQLVGALDRGEFRSLLRWPHVLVTGLHPFQSVLKTDPHYVQNQKNNPLNLSRVSIAPNDVPDGIQIATNLIAQWKRKLGVPVKLASSREADLALMEFQLNPFQLPSGARSIRARVNKAPFPRLAQTKKNASTLVHANWIISQLESELIGKGTIVFPLFLRSKQYLASAKVANLRWNPIGRWNFEEVTFQ